MKSSLAFLRQHVLPVAVSFALALAISTTELFRRVDNVTLDQLTKLRAQLKPTPPDKDLLLIGIDEESLKDFGAWPWSRNIHGDFLLLTRLRQPSVVAWDILFTEPTANDGQLAKGAAAGGSSVVFGAVSAAKEEGITPESEEAKASQLTPLTNVHGDRARILSSEAMLLPVAPFNALAQIGFVDTPPDIDGVRRSAPLVVRIGDSVYPTLSLRSLMQYWQVKPEDVVVRLADAVYLKGALGERRIPVDATGAYRINYRHALGGFLIAGYSRTYARLKARFVDQNRAVEPPEITGKILLIGQVADGLADFGPTPFSPLTPLVLVHANVIENVLREDYVRFVPVWAVWAGGLLLGVAGLWRFSDRKLRDQAIYSLGIPVAFGAVAALVYIGGSWTMPVVGPIFAFGAVQVFMIGRRVLAEQKAKEQIKGMFGTYLSPQLVTRMVDSGEMPRLGGHEEEITAYFSDIQGFSGFSEILPPDRLVELMNEYLTVCTDIVQEEGGTLDKYIGDAVVAMFGAPISLPDHAFRACVATQRVQLSLAGLREKWKAEGDKWPEIVWRMQSRIGLNSGPAVVGNMGSRSRFNYTMMGDNVNLAARMESGSKSWGVYAMCAGATKAACEKHGGDRVVFRPLGKIVVKGRTNAVPIYEIVGLKENVTEQTQECVGLFSEALDRYYARDWDAALTLLGRSGDLEPNIPGKTPGVSSNPTLIYREIVAHLKSEPPPEHWDGAYVMKEK